MIGKLTILKLGGSVITKKEKELTPNKRAITRLAKEIEQAKVKHLLLIHGGGSFGHPIAEKYHIKEGYKDKYQILGFSKTHQNMIALNEIVLNALIKRRIPAVSLQPSAFVTTDNGRIKFMETRIIRKLLELGVTPVLYGDVILDSTLGFTILSGDQLATSLALKLGAERIIMGVDEDGIYTADPKIDSSARLIQYINPQELRTLQHKIEKTNVPDVTGGMFGKILELVPAVSEGVKAIIVNGSKPNNVYRALRKEKVLGTLIGLGERFV